MPFRYFWATLYWLSSQCNFISSIHELCYLVSHLFYGVLTYRHIHHHLLAQGVKRSLDFNPAAPSSNPAQTNPIQSGITNNRNKPAPGPVGQMRSNSFSESESKMNQVPHGRVSEKAKPEQADSEFVKHSLPQSEQHKHYQQQKLTVQMPQMTVTFPHHLQQHNTQQPGGEVQHAQQHEVSQRKHDRQSMGPHQPPFPNPQGGNPNGPIPRPRMPTSSLNMPRPPTIGPPLHTHPPPQHFMGHNMLPPTVLVSIIYSFAIIGVFVNSLYTCIFYSNCNLHTTCISCISLYSQPYPSSILTYVGQ